MNHSSIIFFKLSNKNFISEANTPTLTDLADGSWLWLIDLERCCGLLIGRCLGGMMVGPPLSEEEKESFVWLDNKILSRGLESGHADFQDEFG